MALFYFFLKYWGLEAHYFKLTHKAGHHCLNGTLSLKYFEISIQVGLVDLFSTIALLLAYNYLITAATSLKIFG